MGFISCLVPFLLLQISKVSAKYCWYSSQGYTKYFYCNSYEYCCGNSCCENFTQFYKLWYFWFCVVLSLLFCSGGGYWYRKRYIQRRFMIGQPQTNAVVTMTQSSTASADGTCTRIPTGTLQQQQQQLVPLVPPLPQPTNTEDEGMTYQAACGCPTQESQAIYAPPSYPPPAPASTPATHPSGTLLLSGVVRITQKGSVIYQTVPCGPPPSYDSILQLAEACNCCQTQRSIENVGGSDGNIAGGDMGSGGAEGIAAPRLRRCVSNEYVQFCHVDGRQVVVGPHANTCPVCEANRRRIEQEDAYVYSPMTPPPPAGVEGAESDYGIRERPQIPKYDDGPQPMDLIYNLPVDPNSVVVRPTALHPDKPPAEGGADGEEQTGECKCECVQCLADCHGNCIYGRLDLKGCKSQNADAAAAAAAAGATAALSVSGDAILEASGENPEGEFCDENRQKQIQQLHQQLRKRHEQHVLEHQKLMQEQHKAFQEQLAKATGRKYPPSRDQSLEDLDSGDIPEEPEEQPLLPEPLKPTQSGDLKLECIPWQHPLQDLAEGGDKEDWMSGAKASSEKTEQTPLLQPVTEVTDPEIRQQLLQRQLLEHQWRLHQQQQLEDKGDNKLMMKDGITERESQYGIIQRRGDGCNQVFVLQPLIPSQPQQPEPIYSISLKQKPQLDQKKFLEDKRQQGMNAAWDLHKQKQLAGVQLPPLHPQPVQETPPPKPAKQKKGLSFWPFSRDKSSSEEKIPLDDRKTRNTKQRLLHQELLQHRLVFRELPQSQQLQTVQQTTQQCPKPQPQFSGQLPPKVTTKKEVSQNENERQSQENLLKFDQPSPRQKVSPSDSSKTLQDKKTDSKKDSAAAKNLVQNNTSMTLEANKRLSQVTSHPLEPKQQAQQQQGTKAQQQGTKEEDKALQKGQPKPQARDKSPQKPERGPPPKPPQRVRFSLSDTPDDPKEAQKDDQKAEHALLDMHASLQEQIPKNETPAERQVRQKKHHQKILQKQAELLEKYKREWLLKKKKEQT